MNYLFTYHFSKLHLPFSTWLFKRNQFHSTLSATLERKNKHITKPTHTGYVKKNLMRFSWLIPFHSSISHRSRPTMANPEKRNMQIYTSSKTTSVSQACPNGFDRSNNLKQCLVQRIIIHQRWNIRKYHVKRVRGT